VQVARRKFAFAREAAGYAHLHEGDGQVGPRPHAHCAPTPNPSPTPNPNQEPVNAVYYKDNGDQYRPHCDGECSGGRCFLGTRL
jgi:hypothetical protein